MTAKLNKEEKDELIYAVEEIAAIREYYGEAKGVQEMATLMMNWAIEKFRDGDDKTASLFRDVSTLLRERAEELFGEWRRINENSQGFWEIVDKYKGVEIAP